MNMTEMEPKRIVSPHYCRNPLGALRLTSRVACYRSRRQSRSELPLRNPSGWTGSRVRELANFAEMLVRFCG